jgi:nucleotide-binding universal stress UspA family protein
MIMDAMNRIMVAVGFNGYAEELLSFATRMAGGLAAELLIVNVINSRDVEAVGSIAAMGYDVDSEQYVSSIKQERRQALEDILKKNAHSADKVRTIIKTGNPTEELLKLALNEDIDLIIMGIKGRTELRHMLVGSVAEKVFRRSPVPILSYRDAKNAARLRKHIHPK